MTRQRSVHIENFQEELKGICSCQVRYRFYMMLVLLLAVIEAYEVLCKKFCECK